MSEQRIFTTLSKLCREYGFVYNTIVRKKDSSFWVGDYFINKMSKPKKIKLKL
jgi:hypothetical protein